MIDESEEIQSYTKYATERFNIMYSALMHVRSETWKNGGSIVDGGCQEQRAVNMAGSLQQRLSVMGTPPHNADAYRMVLRDQHDYENLVNQIDVLILLFLSLVL